MIKYQPFFPRLIHSKHKGHGEELSLLIDAIKVMVLMYLGLLKLCFKNSVSEYVYSVQNQATTSQKVAGQICSTEI